MYYKIRVINNYINLQKYNETNYVGQMSMTLKGVYINTLRNTELHELTRKLLTELMLLNEIYSSNRI